MTPGFHSRYLLCTEWVEDPEEECVTDLRVSVVRSLMRL